MSRLQIIVCMIFVSASLASQGRGQDALAELYGQGVHAYFSGDLNRAEELLTSAIDAGLDDPRAYYFRGLTHVRLAGTGAGTADFQQAATLEMTGRRMVNVSVALERIQGPVRMEIEKARQSARIAARAQLMQQQKARIEQGAQVNRAPAPQAVPVPPTPDIARPVPPTISDAFAPNGDLTTGEKKPMPRDAAPAPPVPSVRPEVDNPLFGEPARTPPVAPAPAPSANIFETAPAAPPAPTPTPPPATDPGNPFDIK